MKAQRHCKLTTCTQITSIDSAYKVLEVARAEFIVAEQKLFAAQAVCTELIKNSDPYKVQRIRQWDNRGEDDV